MGQLQESCTAGCFRNRFSSKESASKEFLPTKILKKAVLKLPKWRFLSKILSFSTKKACKFNTNAPKKAQIWLKMTQREYS